MSRHDPSIIIGHRFAWGSEVPLGIQPEDARHHTCIVGKTGSGKTALLRNLIIQHMHHGHGVAVIDPHGDSLRNCCITFRHRGPITSSTSILPTPIFRQGSIRPPTCRHMPDGWSLPASSRRSRPSGAIPGGARGYTATPLGSGLPGPPGTGSLSAPSAVMGYPLRAARAPSSMSFQKVLFLPRASSSLTGRELRKKKSSRVPLWRTRWTMTWLSFTSK